MPFDEPGEAVNIQVGVDDNSGHQCILVVSGGGVDNSAP